MDLPSAEFFQQFTQLADLSSILPQDESQVAHEKVGSLLLSAVPLEGMGISSLLSSGVGQTGVAALKQIATSAGGRIANIFTKAPQPANTVDTSVEGTELSDMATAGGATEPVAVTTAADVGEDLAVAGGEAVGEAVAGITIGTVLDTIPVIGPIVGLLTTLGIGLKDLLDKPHEPPPVFSSFQMGL